MPLSYERLKKLDMPEYLSKNVELPKPKTGAAGSGRAIFWALISLLALGAIAWWVFQPEESRQELRNEAASKINDALSDTSLAGVGNILRETPPPPPDMVLNPPTNPGTLAGRQIAGVIASPPDLPDGDAQNVSIASEDPATGASQTNIDSSDAVSAGAVPGNALPGDVAAQLPVTEDRQVTPGYIEALANWLASRYQPSTGRLGITAQSLNQYGGITLASRAKGGRSALLRYAFQPSMLQGLYKIYIGRFMDDLQSAAQKKGLSDRQNRQFHMALAGNAVLWAAGLEGIMKLPDLRQRLQKIDDLAQKAVDVNAQLTNAVFELDELRENKASSQQLNTAQLRVDGLASRYRRANEEHAAAQRNLVNQIKQNSGQTLDADTLLFMAAWAERRLSQDADGKSAIDSCIALLRDLGRRCAQAGAND